MTHQIFRNWIWRLWKKVYILYVSACHQNSCFDETDINEKDGKSSAKICTWETHTHTHRFSVKKGSKEELSFETETVNIWKLFHPLTPSPAPFLLHLTSGLLDLCLEGVKHIHQHTCALMGICVLVCVWTCGWTHMHGPGRQRITCDL